MKLVVVFGVVTLVTLFYQIDASSSHRRQKRSLAKLLMHIYYDPVRLIRYYHAYDQAREVLKSWRGVVPTVMLLPFTDRMPDTYGVTRFINPNPEPIREAHSYGYPNYHYVKSPNSYETYLPAPEKHFVSHQKSVTSSKQKHKPVDSGMTFINDNLQRNAGLRNEHKKDEIKNVELQHANVEAAHIASSNGAANYNQANHQLPTGFHNFQAMRGPYSQNTPISFGNNGQGMLPVSHDQILWMNNQPVNALQAQTHMPAFAYDNNAPQMILPHQYQAGGEFIYVPNEPIQHSPQATHIPSNMDYSSHHGVFPYTLPNEVPQETLPAHHHQQTQHQTNFETNANGFDSDDWSYILSQSGDITYVPNQNTGGDSIVQNLGDINSRHVHHNPTLHITTDSFSISNETSNHDSVTDNLSKDGNTNNVVTNNVPFVWQRLTAPNLEGSESVKSKQVPSPIDQELETQNQAHHNHLQKLRARLQHSNVNAVPSSEQNKSRIYQHHSPLTVYHNHPPSNKEEKIPNIEIIKPVLLRKPDSNHESNLALTANNINNLPNVQHIHSLSIHDGHLPKSASHEYRSVSENNLQQPQNPLKPSLIDSKNLEEIHLPASSPQLRLLLPTNDQVLQKIKYQEHKDTVIKIDSPLQENLQKFSTKFRNVSQSTGNDELYMNFLPPVNNNQTITVSSTVKPQWFSDQNIPTEAVQNATTSTTTTTTTMESVEETSEPDSNQISFKYYQNVKLINDPQPVVWTKHEPSSTTTSAPKFPENELELHMPRIRNATNPPKIFAPDNLHQKSSGIQVQAQPFYGTKIHYYPAYETSTKPSSADKDPQRLMLIMLKQKVA